MKRKLLKTITFILILTLTATTTAFAAADTSVAETDISTASVSVPADVSGTDFEEAVKVLMEKGIITGDTDGLFYPNSYLTRAQACVIVVKAMNPPALEVVGTATQPAPKSGFEDMAGYSWAEGYIAYAVEKGVVKGYSDGTFKPGDNVTGNELITMVLRAAGYTDESLEGEWPANYVDKGIELKIFENIPAMHAYATKWMAADFTYNALDKIEAANPPAEPEEKPTKPDTVPDTADMTFVNGSFNDTMTAFNGKTIAADVKIYAYDLKKNYKAEMKFASRVSDYRVETVYKYKNVKTPAFYKEENGKITEMVVPGDVGFSGLVYAVVNDIVTTLNAEDDTVKGLVTLTAGREVTWLGKTGLTGIPAESEYLSDDGGVYQLYVKDGEIQNIFKADNLSRKGFFEELSGTAFTEVERFEKEVAWVDSGSDPIEVNEYASVYLLDHVYTAGKLADIKKGEMIRAYDISDDDHDAADIVVILED